MYAITELTQKINLAVENIQYNAEPKNLYDPIRYILSIGGKRVRPLLMLMGYNLYKEDVDAIMNNALALEAYHNFTLLHDDLMDKSPIRRGQPTVYRKWSENTAILSGDTMFALAWRYFLRLPHPRLQEILNTFNETAIQVCEGQQYDMDFETRDDVAMDEYMHMIRLKTAVLLAGALKIGALYANAPDDDISHLYAYGIHLGLAFQLQDDLLDAYGDTAVFGKETGSDIRDNKKTFLYLKALQTGDATQQATLKEAFSQTPDDPSEKIRQVLSIYSQLNIKQTTEDIIQQEFDQARQELEAIQVDDSRKQPLQVLSSTLLGRKQ